MTGDILTANDPWRVCASLPKDAIISSAQELLGKTEAPFSNGKVLFNTLALREKGINQKIRFDLCYAGTNSLDDLAFKPVMSNSFDVINVDECDLGIDKCDANANCTDTDGEYECICHHGFIGNGFICMQEIDECALDIDDCDANAECNDAPVGYTCACRSGFEGDGYSCFDVDECEDRVRNRWLA